MDGQYKGMIPWLILFCAMVFSGCAGESEQADDDTQPDAGADADTDTDVDTDTDTDIDSGTDTDTDTDTATNDDAGADTDTDEDSDTNTETESNPDTDSDSEPIIDSGPEDDAGPLPPGPAAPCALDLDADLHPDSDVNQVTGTVVPDLGVVPNGGAFVGNPEDDGPYGVYVATTKVPIKAGSISAAGYVIEVQDGTLNGTFYAPSSDGGTTIADGAFPLIIVLPGYQASYTNYATYSRHFASYGFVVLGIDTLSNAVSATHDKEAFQIKQAIDFAGSADSPLFGKLDMTKIAAAGHSKCGKLAFFAAAIDARIDFVIGWDPVNAGGGPCSILPEQCNKYPVAPNCMVDDPGILHYMRAETLVLGMPRDTLVNPDRHHNSIHFYRGAPSPAALVYFDAGHTAPVSNQNVVKINKRVQIAMLLTRFKGMTGLDQHLPTTTEGKASIESLQLVTRVETK